MSKFFIKDKSQKATVNQVSSLQDLVLKLKSENASLGAEISSYRKRECEITEALSMAKTHAEEYASESRIRYKMEGERLARYRKQWQGYLANLSSAEELGKEILRTQKLLKDCNSEIFNALNRDVKISDPEQDFQAESSRLQPTVPDNLSGEDICDLIKQLM
ncbi:MAG: hypothetical protein R3Y23_00120 [Bacillota bacterium]